MAAAAAAARRAASTIATATRRADSEHCARVVRCGMGGGGGRRRAGRGLRLTPILLPCSLQDYDNFLWVALLPLAARPGALALRAFNAETVAAAASEPALAAARALWWKDAAGAAAAGNPPAHPVARSLAAAVADGGLTPASTRYRLGRVAAARAADAAATAPPATVAALEAYGEETASQMLYLHLDAGRVGDGASSGDRAAADHAASHIGVAASLVAVLRGTRAHASRRRCYLPSETLAAAGVSEESIFAAASGAAPPPPGLADAAHPVAAAAASHLDAARRLLQDAPPGAAAYLLQGVGVSRALATLEAAGFDPLHPSLNPDTGRLGLVVATRMAAWRGRF